MLVICYLREVDLFGLFLGLFGLGPFTFQCCFHVLDLLLKVFNLLVFRCVAVSNSRFLASGSSDEAIKLIDLKRRRDFGTLVHHEGNLLALHTSISC